MGTELKVSTFERVLAMLADREWHSRQELDELTAYPDWWLDELRHERIEIVEDGDRIRVLTAA